MATREFIEKRIEGKKKEIEKLEKKLARIEKAQASNWENNPYYYNEYDLKYTTRDIEQAKESLAKYEEELVIIEHKANSRNIKVILDFLENWKVKTREYYEKCIPLYLADKQKMHEASHKHCDWHNNSHKYKNEVGEEEYKRIYKELDEEYKKAYRIVNSWKWLSYYLECGNVINYEKLNKDLDEEANRKYDFIIERTQAIVTEITDASNLRIGNTGELNGFIIGTTGKAKIETIGAGGYNIQCFHFRTLIHKMK